jgi:predicted transposase YbfD/YdcC
LYDDVRLLFDDLQASGYRAYAYSSDKSVDSGHGRIETRRIWVIDDPQVLNLLPNAERWPQLRSLIKIESARIMTAGPLEKRGEHATSDRYYISSATASATFFNAAVRKHWQIKNAAHWVLDVAFREDLARLRRDNGAENFAILRRIALNLLKQDKSSKLGVKNKCLKATWDHNYFLHLLSIMMH